jgi:hypothetical protein
MAGSPTILKQNVVTKKNGIVIINIVCIACKGKSTLMLPSMTS